ncbi:plasmid stabilization protein [Bradyrhizobium hipponense]|uniref:Plasmid stabilization protein n=1 Tax=Bradyrhizobium hipponense TaxID=2605638 RepID=A0A5S4YAJ1_9BRAD|nr:plasmid stabilization protein [Bradyrhizobium hipponense]
MPAADPDVGQGADTQSIEGKAAGASVQRTVIAVACGAADLEENDEDATKPLPDRLITELTAHRTLALRDALAENPAIAFQAVLHNFVLTAFYRFASSGSCLEIGLRTPTFPAQAPGLRESASAKAVEARHESWKARLPNSENDLWDSLTALDGAGQASLFAHCASFAVNAVCEPANRYNQGRVSAHGVRTRLDQADVLARAVGLDMVQAGWKPSVDNYLGRVTKPRILEAVREARGESSAQLIDHLKKADMAKDAERLLDGSGWLPEPLRLVDPNAASVEQESETDPLPEFLANEEDQENAGEDDPQQLDAAE